jgi:hypothetical protein
MNDQAISALVISVALAVCFIMWVATAVLFKVALSIPTS